MVPFFEDHDVIMTSPNQLHMTQKIKGPVIIYCLAGRRILGDYLIFRKTKGGIMKTLEGFRGGTTQICSENEDMGGGGGITSVK